MYNNINGIQHVGIAVQDLDASWKWYRKYFGLDVPFFDSVAEAPLMKIYTNDEVIEKRAALVMNLRGGCGVEIIQPTSFAPKYADFEVMLGDLGLFITHIKTTSIEGSYQLFKKDAVPVSEMSKDPLGRSIFYVTDPNGNVFQVVEGNQWYSSQKHISGGVSAVTIGVSDMEKALKFYGDIMGYEEVRYDKTGTQADWARYFKGGEGQFRRVLIGKPGGETTGPWGDIGGDLNIELVQALDREPNKIFENRVWGDTGIAHLGFDVRGMSVLEEKFAESGHPFTCDTNDVLDMGNTQVRCVYVEDPDGTLIELIEVYRIPLIEKWGVFLNVQKREPHKAVPSWLIKLMRFNRVKN